MWRPSDAGWIGTGGTGWALSWEPSRTSRGRLWFCDERAMLSVSRTVSKQGFVRDSLDKTVKLENYISLKAIGGNTEQVKMLIV